MLLRKSPLGVMGIILAFALGAFATFAQEPQPQTVPRQDGTIGSDRIEGMERHRERQERRGEIEGHTGRGRRGGMGHLMRELNLTEEQRKQSRDIMQRRLEGTKFQREELFKLREKRIAETFTAEDEARAKALHQEIRTAMEGIRAEMEGVLTAEQKAKLEELRTARKERMEQRMKDRQERLNKQPR